MVRILMPRTPVARRYPGKAIIHNTPDRLVLELPAFVLGLEEAFLMLWLPLWGTGCLAMLVTGVVKMFSSNFGNGIEPLVVAGLMALVGLILLRKFLWMMRGKEIITLTAEELTIWRKGLLFAKPRSYTCRSIRNLRVGPPPDVDWRGRKYHPRYGPYARYGRIVFYADSRRVEFGEGIEADEGAHLVKLLQARLDAYAASAAS